MGLFGSSGIRRIADRALLEIALRTGLALGRTHKTVVVGRDTRNSGNAVKHALVSGLLAAGTKCYDAGVVPTPTLAIAARDFDAAVMVTASHNPPEYNGLKILNADGSGFELAQQAELEKLILSDPLPTVTWRDMTADSVSLDGVVENHVACVLKRVAPSSGVRVVVDCACGAGSVITPYLLRRMGCDVIALNSHPSGFFPHEVEPVQKNLTDLIKITSEVKGIGIAHDGDADRMMAVDEEGRFISGDKLLVILARDGEAKEVVTTVDASMAIEEAGFNVKRTKVGDTYVSEHLRRGGDFGGEPSGAWIFPKNSYCPDGIYAAAALVSLAGRQKLSALVDAIPQYPVYRGSVANDGATTSEIENVLLAMGPQDVDRSDGVKLIFEDGWLLVRPSGTEPKIRVTAEAKTEARAHQLYDRAVESINGIQHT